MQEIQAAFSNPRHEAAWQLCRKAEIIDRQIFEVKRNLDCLSKLPACRSIEISTVEHSHFMLAAEVIGDDLIGGFFDAVKTRLQAKLEELTKEYEAL